MTTHWSARGTSASQRSLHGALQFIGLGGFFLLVAVFFALATPQFLTVSNTLNILENVAVIGIVALGQALAIVSGGFDLSVAGVLPLAAVAYVTILNGGQQPIVAAVVVLGIAAFVGLVNGAIITRGGINPLITTLAMLSITSGLAFTVSKGTTITFGDFDAGVLIDDLLGVPAYVWLAGAMAIGTHLVLRLTVFGRTLYAIGGNREASRLAGIRVDATTTAVYLLCATGAGVAGIVVANQLLAASPTMGQTSNLTSIAAVILGGASLAGGVGGIPGTMLGVLVLGTIANGMALMQVPVFYQLIATGVVLLLAVGFSRLRALVTGSEE